MVGLFVVAMIGFSVVYDLWMLLDIKRGLTMVSGTWKEGGGGGIWKTFIDMCVSCQNQFLKHFYARAFSLILVPVVIYLFWFYVHFAILIESGPGDAFMTTRFQDTLQNSPLKMSALGECRTSSL